jgi:uncharacterized protein
MILFDVNVLVYAHRPDSLNHSAYSAWLERVLSAEEPFGLADLVLSGFLRIVTNRKVFRFPTPLAQAMAFVEAVRNQPNCLSVVPGPRHWPIFSRLCREAQAVGNLVPDAYLAALAIESGCEWITTDSDFRHFPGLRWRHPLE